MNTLIVYDDTGYVISQSQGLSREPQGVPFLWVDIPSNKRLKIADGIGIDVSVTPHQAILEDIPPSEIENLRLEMAQSNTELFEMMIAMSGGTA
ncbi:hypothetical protein [Bacillus solitudinis]|uniref:hypothetical protein n=1 Tax=Bacillus solitudinis TaxID=2014074 RepID=UPI000C235EA5|nr:hypothetical protein [Bacillus solitudinis]